MNASATTELANVPHPADATHVGDWYDTAAESPGRYFTGVNWQNQNEAETEILIDGTQRADGSEEQFITVAEGYKRLTELTQRPRSTGRPKPHRGCW